MALRFKKRIRIAKGVYLNVGKNGISTSVGGGGLTVNSKGRMTTSLKGTGLSYSTNLNKKQKQAKQQIDEQQESEFIEINSKRIDFDSVDEAVNYLMPNEVDKTQLRPQPFNKWLMAFWGVVVVALLTQANEEAMLFCACLIPAIYLIIWFKRKKDFAKNLVKVDEINEQLRSARQMMRDTITELEDKYELENAYKIISQHLWIGEPAEAVEISLGSPIKIDEQILKTKTKKTYFYNQINSRSYALKVFFENDVVSGWEVK